jgi:hypothetical protein
MSDVAKTAALLAEVFPGSDISRTDYLEWLYERSPFGPVIESNLDDEQGRAGHYALVPIAIADGEARRDAALSLNTAVHERARGGGTFVRLAGETIAAAASQGVTEVVGVANANSTPGFVRRLEFELLTELPATVMLPTPGSTRAIRSAAVDDGAFGQGGLAAGADALLAVPAAGEMRLWTPETLGWRLARPGARYALHRRADLLAVSCAERQRGVTVAVLLKVFTDRDLTPASRRALVRAACRHHRAPVALHVGLNDLARFRGVALPKRLRPSPLNLIRRWLDGGKPAGAAGDRPVARFELLDFDAY